MIAILQRAYNVYVYGGKEVVFTAYAEKFYKVKYTRKVLLPKVDPKPL